MPPLYSPRPQVGKQSRRLCAQLVESSLTPSHGVQGHREGRDMDTKCEESVANVCRRCLPSLAVHFLGHFCQLARII